MLVHQTQSSEGVGTAGVNASNHLVSNGRISGTCHSGIRLGSDGILYLIQANGGFSAFSGEWLITGTASDFYVQHTIISGTLEVDPPVATWNQLNTNRDYDNQKSSAGIKITEVFFEFSSDMSGSPIVETATMVFESEQGDL